MRMFLGVFASALVLVSGGGFRRNENHSGGNNIAAKTGKRASRVFDDVLSITESTCYRMASRGGWKGNSTRQGRQSSVADCAKVCESLVGCKKFQAASSVHGIMCTTWQDNSRNGTTIPEEQDREQYAYAEDDCPTESKETQKVDGLRLQASIVAIPSICMALGSLLALVLGQTSEHLMAALQNLGAGLILAAVGMELLPKVVAVKAGIVGTMAITIGFSSGIGLMLLIKALTSDDEEDAGDDAGKTPDAIVATASADKPVVRKRSSMIGKAVNAQSGDQAPHSLTERENLLQTEASNASPTAKIPWTMAFAVGVDSIMDGLLIGIVLVASMHAGCIMAGATAIEMGFLGLTFTTSLQNLPAKSKLPISLVMPVLLQLGGIAGCILAGFLENSPEIFGGVIAFGVAALLYLVTRELLLEAHEKEGETDLWYVNIWLFVGFLAVILGDRLTNSA